MPALILLAYASLFTFGVIDNIRGPFYPDVLSDLELDGTRGSAFFAVVSAMGFVGALTAHNWLMRFSTVALVRFASLIFGLGFILVSQARGFPTLIMACVIFGWALGTLNVTPNILVCEASTEFRRRQWLSGLHAMYGISALVAPLFSTLMRSWGFDWRASFLVLAVPPILLALFPVRPAPRDCVNEQLPVPAIRTAKIALYAALMAVYLWGELSVSTRLVLWLRRDRAFSPDVADAALAGFFLALLCGRLVFTFFNFKRLGNWRVLLLSAAGGGGLYLAALHHSPWWIVASGLIMAPFYPVMMDQTSRAFGAAAPRALSFVVGAGNLSLVAMHLTIGRLSDFAGVTAALHAGAFALLGVALALVAVDWASRPSYD